MKPGIDIIIINWNSGPQLEESVASIVHHHNNLVSSVVIVDNASSDDSLRRIENLVSLPFQFLIIRNAENCGFGVGCNIGAKQANGEYLLFLNPDTRLFEDSLAVPLAFMEDEANQDVGICGIQLIDEKGYVAHTCARFPSLLRFAAQAIGLNKLSGLREAGMRMDEWDHLSDKAVDQVIGAFFFTRRNVFAALNGFDERFFVYFEEVDFSLRAKQTGWKTIYIANAQVFHRGGGTSQQIKATRLFYSLQSRLLYGFVHFSLWQAYLLLGIVLLVEPFSRLVFSFFRGGVSEVSNTLRGYAMLYYRLPAILGRLRRNTAI